ncbi:MAG TPA: sulfotransferase [Longimicrobiales bacterium]|nr:sulfotransferase [Longimicrobiales bacterium]
MKVIGAGVGRTGTYSLKLAINRLGLGPCHHMEEVLLNRPRQLPLWVSALNGEPDWAAVYEGYESAVDWPTAGFFRELSEAYPDAKFVLSVRSPESWAASFSETIYKLMAGRDEAPDDMKPWLDWATGVIEMTGFPAGLDIDGLEERYVAHNDAVRATIPDDRLLVYQVTEGWGPLCEFLGAEVPDEPFPRTNDRAEFWELVKGGQ